MDAIDRSSIGASAKPRRQAVKVAESIAVEIFQDISDRDLTPGTRLQAESDMAETYGLEESTLSSPSMPLMYECFRLVIPEIIS